MNLTDSMCVRVCVFNICIGTRTHTQTYIKKKQVDILRTKHKTTTIKVTFDRLNSKIQITEETTN